MLNIEAINERFVAFSKVILKFRAVILVAMVLILAISFYGLKQLKSDTDDSHYFNEGDELLLAKDYMASIFGNDNFCAVLVHVDNVFTPHVLTGIREMGRELEAKVPYVDDVILNVAGILLGFGVYRLCRKFTAQISARVGRHRNGGEPL